MTEDVRSVVERFVVAFRDGRLSDALDLLHDDFVIHAAGDVPYTGDYHGAEGFSVLISKMMESLELTPSLKGRPADMTGRQLTCATTNTRRNG